MKSRIGELNFGPQGPWRSASLRRQSHEAFFRDGLSKKTVDFEKQWKVMSQARLCCRVCGGLVSERSPLAQLLMMNNIRRRLAPGRMSGGAESLVRQDNVVRHAKASE